MLLILREEAVCLCILLFLLNYSWKFIRSNQFFLRLNLFALSHVVLDFVTICTVNHVDTVPLWLNWVLHVLFYITAILFCCELLRFVLNLLPGERRSAGRWVYLIPVLFLLATPFLRIDYLEGRGSYYSYGPCVFVGYGIAMLLFLASEVLLLTQYRKLESNIKKTLIPSFALMTVAVIVQAFVPELLFTGAAVTLVTAGVFLSIANPMEKYREWAFYDATLRIKNRNAYTDQMQKLAASSGDELWNQKFTLVGFDMNGLKRINDQFGHPAGDQYLRAAADILQMELQSAHGVFRTGGDEFAAIYLDTDLSVVETEVARVDAACAGRTMAYEIPLSISHGWAVVEQGENVYGVERRADRQMFENKRKRYENTAFDRRKR